MEGRIVIQPRVGAHVVEARRGAGFQVGRAIEEQVLDIFCEPPVEACDHRVLAFAGIEDDLADAAEFLAVAVGGDHGLAIGVLDQEDLVETA